jgi:hypothetical protein
MWFPHAWKNFFFASSYTILTSVCLLFGTGWNRPFFLWDNHWWYLRDSLEGRHHDCLSAAYKYLALFPKFRFAFFAQTLVQFYSVYNWFLQALGISDCETSMSCLWTLSFADGIVSYFCYGHLNWSQTCCLNCQIFCCVAELMLLLQRIRF